MTTPQRPFPWEKSYPAGMVWDLPTGLSTVPEIFGHAASTFASSTALEYRGRCITYADLRRDVERAAAAFLALGHGQSRPVALYLPNVPYHPVAFFGGLKAGATLVHLSPLDADRELAFKISDSGARTVVTSNIGDMLPKALKLLDGGLIDRVIVGDDSAFGPSPFPLTPIPSRDSVLPLDDFLASAAVPAAWPDVRPGDIALIQYTGGTTGKPKGAILTHANFTSAIASYEAGSGALLSQPEIVICVLPLFHIYALTVILLRGIQNGAKLLLRPRFDPEQTLHDIETGRATMFPGVPTMWIALTNRPDIARRDLSSLRYCGSGGAPLPVEVQSAFTKLTGLTLRGGWGMTETSPAGTFIPENMAVPVGTVGLPLPGIELGIVALDDPRRPLKAGETGELRVRGPNVTQGYWHRPEETAAAMAGGYLLTGDIGYMDENGFFFIVDRKKDMIISGGFNVYPQAIEQAIYEHPAVEEAVVIGVPDGYRGEAAKAFVKLKTGASAFTLDELNLFLADKIGRYEMPAHLEIRPSLPRTAVGKLSKIELREEERAKAKATLEPAAP